MRFLVVSFLFSALAVSAQDATQLAIQANQQAMDAMQQASQQSIQQAQQASQQAAQSNFDNVYVAKPRFSMKPGAYPSAITLRMKDSTRGTVIYYTTDGWTPTTLSSRYTGPITLSSTATLQAIAVTPKNDRSGIVSATYTISGAASEPISTTFPGNAPGYPILMPGTPLPLVFTTRVTSRGLQVGDKLPIALAQDLVVGGVLLASKSTPVFATVTQVDNNSFNGLPGTLSFAVHSITLNNSATIFLSGTETKEGQSHIKAATGAYIIPLGGLFVHGKDAEIPSGASFTALVDSDSSSQAKISPAHAASASQ